jgi:hypothetical protein
MIPDDPSYGPLQSNCTYRKSSRQSTFDENHVMLVILAHVVLIVKIPKGAHHNRSKWLTLERVLVLEMQP